MDEDEADILGGSLDILYGLTPIAHSSANDTFTYQPKSAIAEAFHAKGFKNEIPVAPIKLKVPDTAPGNWSLYASYVWASALHLVDHLDRLEALYLPKDSCDAVDQYRQLSVLELGAGAGLPSILISRFMSSRARVIVSDYPDPLIIRALEHNIQSNGLEKYCKAAGYAWGEDTLSLQNALFSLPANMQKIDQENATSNLFDVVVAADTLWNSETHAILVKTLCMTLKKSATSRAYLVAGFHTGRWTVQAFLERITKSPLALRSIREHEVEGDQQREWNVNRAEEEDEKERRRWVVWLTLGWDEPGIESS
jgi:EEF1A N-terminal glycine/lysine methyltransferase